MTSNGEPFHFLPTAPDVLFCKGSPTMKKVIMTIQSDLLESASKRRQTPTSVAPRVLTKKRKVITRRVSFPESIRVQHQLGDSSFLKLLPYAHISWLTVILISEH